MNKAFVREPDNTDVLCPRCGAAGTAALRVAFESHVAPEIRRPLAASVYFCSTPTCPVAYFDAFEAVVPAAALLRAVYPKDPSAPLCSCFGLTLCEQLRRRRWELTPDAEKNDPAAACKSGRRWHISQSLPFRTGPIAAVLSWCG